VSNLSVELPSGFEMTAFQADSERRVFFLGSRQGALACYEISSAKLVGVWRRVHGEEGVRSIQKIGPVGKSISYTEILTTGRNGVYRIIRLSFPEHFNDTLPKDVVNGSLEGVTMHFVHKSSLNRGWLEGVSFQMLRKLMSRPQLSILISFYGDFIPRSLACGMRLQVS
jgi:hypothetical protein